MDCGEMLMITTEGKIYEGIGIRMKRESFKYKFKNK